MELKTNNLKPVNQNFTKDEKKIITLIQEGYGIGAIAKLSGYNKRLIYNKCRVICNKMNIPFMPHTLKDYIKHHPHLKIEPLVLTGK